jgi:retinol-binding protein 3
MNRKVFLFSLTALAVLAAAPASAQPGRGRMNQPDMKLAAGERDTVIANMVDVVVDNYIFPDVAEKMKASILDRQKNGEYDKVTSAAAFADSLTAHLQAVSHDKHLRVMYSHEPLSHRAMNEPPTPEEIARQERFMSVRNYGFERAERLMGNVGYLDLRSFAADGREAKEAASHAMNFLANTDALIVDVRFNGGGSPEMVQYLCTYLFGEGEKVHLNDLYNRPDNRTEEFWTLAEVPGRRYTGKDVFILTSNRTFSAAEEFTYNLKNLKRATIVGETTGGGAHPVSGRRLSDHFDMMVSTSRAISPVTGTNWEGTGVPAHIPVPADEALKTAHLEALRRLLASAPNDDEKQRLEMALQQVESPETGTAAGPVIKKRAGG